MTPRRQPKRIKGVRERVKGSGVWWIRYRDEYGREHQERIGPQGVAEKVLAKRQTEIAERRFFPEAIRRVATLDEYAERYLETQTRAASYKDLARYGRHWCEALGDRQLREINADDVRRYAARRSVGISVQTLKHEVDWLRGLFRAAIKDGLVRENPVQLKLRPQNERTRWLTDKEERALMRELAEKWHPHVVFALHTGLRQDEQFSLKWTDVDTDAQTVRIPKSKSGKPRFVPLNQTALGVLRSLPRRLRNPYVFAPPFAKGKLNARNFTQRVFRPAAKRAGFGNDVKWHDLRHTFASRMVMAGVGLKALADILGHSSTKMTERYSHLTPEHRLGAVQRLNGIAEKARKVKA